MLIDRGKRNTIRGNRTVVYCEGDRNSSDILFYQNILKSKKKKFKLKPLGSSNTLLCFAETNLIENGFCLIDKDFRTDKEVEKLEGKYKIKCLPVHEIENLLLNPKYLRQLDYYREKIDIKLQIKEVIKLKRVRFLADFLQFKINTHLEKFPRISKLKNSELPDENKLVDTLLSKLDKNYEEVQSRVKEIEENYIERWKLEFENLKQNDLAGKEIFKELKNRIFNNPPRESDIVKDIALLMEADGFIPSELQNIFG
jgi:hypothetical protein